MRHAPGQIIEFATANATYFTKEADKTQVLLSDSRASPREWEPRKKSAFLDRIFPACYTGRAMKADTHPAYYPNAKFSCACGAHWTGGSTKEAVEAGICSQCHPFYTGQEKILDTRGRVEKFKKRLEKTAAKARKAR